MNREELKRRHTLTISRLREMGEGAVLHLFFPAGQSTIARFVEIETYPASGMPSDAVFDYISGDESLSKSSNLSPLFPFPEGLLSRILYVELPREDYPNPHPGITAKKVLESKIEEGSLPLPGGVGTEEAKKKRVAYLEKRIAELKQDLKEAEAHD